jgi:hypothetical protein
MESSKSFTRRKFSNVSGKIPDGFEVSYPNIHVPSLICEVTFIFFRVLQGKTYYLCELMEL